MDSRPVNVFVETLESQKSRSSSRPLDPTTMQVDHLLRACTLVQSVNILRDQCVNFAEALERGETIVICIGKGCINAFPTHHGARPISLALTV